MRVKRVIATLIVLVFMGVLVAVVGHTIEPTSALLPIEADSPCPVVGCASGTCHGYDTVPVPDGINEMVCPETGCASVDCHAWESLTSRYHQASDASLNLWILMPVALVGGLIILVRTLSRNTGSASVPKAEAKEDGDE